MAADEGTFEFAMRPTRSQKKIFWLYVKMVFKPIVPSFVLVFLLFHRPETFYHPVYLMHIPSVVKLVFNIIWMDRWIKIIVTTFNFYTQKGADINSIQFQNIYLIQQHANIIYPLVLVQRRVRGNLYVHIILNFFTSRVYLLLITLQTYSSWMSYAT